MRQNERGHQDHGSSTTIISCMCYILQIEGEVGLDILFRLLEGTQGIPILHSVY